MKIKSILIIFIICPILVLANKTRISGIVKDEFNFPLECASVWVEGKTDVVYTNEFGKYKLKGNFNIGDVIHFKRAGFIDTKRVIVNVEDSNYNQLMNYDYLSIRQQLAVNPHQTCGVNFEVEHVFNFNRTSEYCQPLFITDGTVYNESNTSQASFTKKLTRREKKNMLKENDISRVQVLKGQNATDKFGDCAKNGVFLIFTTCYYQNKHYEIKRN